MRTPTRHKITFTDPSDVTVVVLAQLGRSTAYIMEQTGLSECQIAYRLQKAKTAEGYDKGHTYRSEWRNGTGAAARMIETTYVPSLSRQVKGKLPKLFAPPVLRGWDE